MKMHSDTLKDLLPKIAEDVSYKIINKMFHVSFRTKFLQSEEKKF